MRNKAHVFIGISGGIDSAASVILLKNLGYKVTGVHLKTTSENEDIKQLEDSLKIEIIQKDIQDEFREKITEKFISDYISGITPSPCTSCNNEIKWKHIRETSLAHNGDLWATGHYCNIERANGLYYVSKGIDPLKDQSYYLWQLSQQTLEGAIFPLGNQTKSNIYQLMKSHGYNDLVERPQSMGICFLNKKSYKDFLIESRPELIELNGGDVLDIDGNIIATHAGYPFYTIAQKKGIDLPNGYCITKIDHKSNTLFAGKKEWLYTKIIRINNWHFHSIDEAFNTDSLVVKIRGIGLNPDGFCRIEKKGDIIEIVTENPAWAVAKGQPVVFYIRDRVIGGGYAL